MIRLRGYLVFYFLTIVTSTILLGQLFASMRLNAYSVVLIKTGFQRCVEPCTALSPLAPQFLVQSDLWTDIGIVLPFQETCGLYALNEHYQQRLRMMQGLQLILAGQSTLGNIFLLNNSDKATDPWFNLVAGNIWMEQGQSEKAFRKWQCAAPYIETYLVAVADLFFKSGDYFAYEQVLRTSLQYCQQQSTRVGIYRRLGSLMLYQRKDPKAAVPLLTEAMILDSGEYLARVSLAHALVQIEQYDRALSHGLIALDRPEASQNRPLERARILRITANAYLGVGDYANALTFLKQSLYLDPNSRWGHLSLARVYDELGESKLAEKERLFAKSLEEE